MGDFISREAAKEALYKTSEEYDEYDKCDRIAIVALNNADEMLNDIPAADVVEVRHGRWINICGDRESPRQCSECLQDFDYIDGIGYLVSGQQLPNYCPNCGAKMDGGQE